MRLLTILTILLVFQLCTLSGQGYEVGPFVGVTNYMGDLSPKHFVHKEFNLAGGVAGRYNYHHNLSFKASLMMGRLSGTDSHSDLASSRRQRNLSFQANIYELSLQAEFNLLGYDVLENFTQLTPFFFTGISGFYFNPEAFYDSKWHDLQPLSTEGQGLGGNGSSYSKVQLSIPMGMGLKLSISERVNFWMEAGVRKTFTDYLDDVSDAYPQLETLSESKGLLAATLSFRAPEFDEQYAAYDPSGQKRGNPNADDWYIMAAAGFTFNLGLSNFGHRPIPRGKPIF